MLRIFSAVGLGVSMLLAASNARADTRSVDTSVLEAFQLQIVELFSKNRCDEVVRLSRPEIAKSLRPNVMAILAYCDPPWANPEELFKLAEDRSPTGDLILVLHAKYRMKRNPKSADPLWQKVLLLARNPAFRQMASDALEGVSTEERPINLSPVTLFGSVLVGAGQESNPRPEEFVFLTTHGSGASFVKADATWRRWYNWGSIAATYNLGFNEYFSEPIFDSLTQNLKIPFAMHVAASKDMVVQPIFGYTRIGGSFYQSFHYGLGVSGVVYKDNYKQSVEGKVYQESINNPQLASVGGAHYRFEYSWEFFPIRQYYSTLIWVEHVSAGNTTTFNGVTGYFPFSHTDFGGDFKLEKKLSRFTLGFAPRFSYRIDSEDSVFPLVTTGTIVTKKRSEWTVEAVPSITFPINSSVEIYAWYELMKVFSNMGREDYANRNLTDNIVGAALKIALSTY